jgi:hypothetical protein
VTEEAPSAEPRPLNQLAALSLVLAFPGSTFRRLVARPHWVVPLVFVMCAAVLSGLVALGAGLLDESIEQQGFLTGSSPAEIRAGAPTAMIVSGVVGVIGATLFQTLILIAIARLYGGRSTFRRAFSAVCHASVPIGLSAILMTALIPFVHRSLSGLNLSFLFDRATQPLLWGLGSQLDVAVVWFFILVGIASEPVFGLTRKRAVATATTFGVVSVLVLGLLARGEASGSSDPYENWSVRTIDGIRLHADRDAPKETLAVIGLVCKQAEDRASALTGLRPGAKDASGAGGPGLGRIDCYVYPSLEEKRLITGNSEIAQRVEWANAVHLAWGKGAESALTRELVKLMDARAYGKVYTPLIRDGIAVCAGRTWDGVPVREAARYLLGRSELPDLDELVDTVQFMNLNDQLSQPAAGSLICFIVDEKGEGAARGLYKSVAGRSVEPGPLLSAVLGDSLGGVERRWHEYLRSGEESAPDVEGQEN